MTASSRLASGAIVGHRLNALAVSSAISTCYYSYVRARPRHPPLPVEEEAARLCTVEATVVPTEASTY